jgi:hypothetical protein
MSFKTYLNERETKTQDPKFDDKLEVLIPYIYNTFLSKGRDIDATIDSILKGEDVEDPKAEKEIKQIVNFNKVHLKKEKNSSGISKKLRVFVNQLTKKLEDTINSPLTFLGDKKISSSEEWFKYKKEDGADGRARASQPKTDFYDETETKKISYKNMGGSKVLSGKNQEYLSLVSTTVYKTMDSMLKESFDELYGTFKEKGTSLIRVSSKKSIKDIDKINNALAFEAEWQGLDQFVGDGHQVNLELFDKQGESYFLKKIPSEALNGLRPGQQKNALKNRELLLKSLDDDFSEYVKVKSYQDAHVELTSIFQNFFNKNEHMKMFKKEILKEAITGNLKFGEESINAANHIMYTSPTDGFTIVKEINDEVLDQLTNVYEFDFAFKSGHPGQSWSEIRLGVSGEDEEKNFKGYHKDFNAQLKNVDGGEKGNLALVDPNLELAGVEEGFTFQDYMEMFTEEAELKTSMLQEGLLDSATSFVSSVKTMLKNLWVKYVDKMIKVATQSIQHFLAFFDLDVEVSSTSQKDFERILEKTLTQES